MFRTFIWNDSVKNWTAGLGIANHKSGKPAQSSITLFNLLTYWQGSTNLLLPSGLLVLRSFDSLRLTALGLPKAVVSKITF